MNNILNKLLITNYFFESNNKNISLLNCFNDDRIIIKLLIIANYQTFIQL
jgi:hypothetical protein